MSPFNTTLVREVAEVVVGLLGGQAEAVHQATECSKQIFQSWGQTKVVEDGNREMRNLESHDVLNRTIGLAKQWDGLRTREVIKAHGWQEVDPDTVALAETPPKPVEAGAMYHAVGHTPL
eukprot:9892841-Lingulodinium_polyedra.AAC.1